ncbi:MAG: hypothetical protein ABGY96_20600 [bacterium]|nr:hypothetical protein [Gammaproteobacteria bacterium]HIL96362.1 hypothetical protein [Pseudomonadales bacterium]
MKLATMTLRLILALPVLLVGPTQAADLPPWAQPDVVMAALEIRMSEDQIPQFREAVSTYISDLTAMVSQVSRGNNATGIERKIRSKNNHLVQKMDERMAEFLSAEQMQKYEIYRDLLLAAMTP